MKTFQRFLVIFGLPSNLTSFLSCLASVLVISTSFPVPPPYFFLIYLFFFIWLHLWHMEVPGLQVELELKLLAYTTATATRDLSRIFDLRFSSWQCQILNPLSEARDRIHILAETMVGS